MTPDVCPNCGEEVPRNAKACPECGACEKTGWSEEADAADLGLPDDSFDYNEYVKREFQGEEPKRKGAGLWIITAVVLLVLIAWALLSPHGR
jgi:hypothetical protein